jgi:DNA-binding CsgD family transcriptional regulator
MDYLQEKISAIQLVRQRQALQQLFNQLLMHEPYRWGVLLVADRAVLSSTAAPARFSSAALQQQLGLTQISGHTPKLYPASQTGAEHDVLLVPLTGQHAGNSCTIVQLIPGQITGLLAEKIGWYWQLVSAYLAEAVLRTEPVLNQQQVLTPRELECLTWASAGKTSGEISLIVGISERTVNFHMGNCLQKTNSMNRQQAIAKCLFKGVIFPQ